VPPGKPDRLGDPVGPGLGAADAAEREPGVRLEPVQVRQERGRDAGAGPRRERGGAGARSRTG